MADEANGRFSCACPELRDELLALRAADLELREELIRDGTLFVGYHPRMAELHRRHNARLRQILAAHGWPGNRLVGGDGATAAWLLLQHAILDPPLMRLAVPLVAQAVANGECDPVSLAMLTDRILTLEGKPQQYGTQHDWDAEGHMSPLPIAAPEAVDERRRAVGLDSLAENTSRLRAQAAVEGEAPPADFVARQRDAENWARETGWR
jgi:hypothetical protein